MLTLYQGRVQAESSMCVLVSALRAAARRRRRTSTRYGASTRRNASEAECDGGNLDTDNEEFITRRRCVPRTRLHSSAQPIGMSIQNPTDSVSDKSPMHSLKERTKCPISRVHS